MKLTVCEGFKNNEKCKFIGNMYKRTANEEQCFEMGNKFDYMHEIGEKKRWEAYGGGFKVTN